MSIFYKVYGNVADCAAASLPDATYATARASTAASFGATSTAQACGQRFSTPNYTCAQVFLQFDLSAAPTGGTSFLELNCSTAALAATDTIEVHQVSAITNKIAGGSIAGLTSLGSMTTPTTTGHKQITMTADPTRSATSRLLLSSGKENAGTAPLGVDEQPSFTLADQTGTTNDPFIQGLTGTAWDFIAAGTSVEATATSHILTEPAGVAAGDLLVACIASRIASTTSITLPSGWTLVAEAKNNNTLSTSSALPSGMMAYIIRGGSAPSYTFTHPVAPNVALGRVVAYRNAAQTTPVDGTTAVTTGTALLSVSVTGLNTTLDDDLIVALTAGGQEAAWSAFAATDPATSSGATASSVLDPIWGQWLERADVQTTTGNDGSLAIYDAVKQTAGATGNLIATASVSAGHVVVAGSFKLVRPTAVNFGDIVQTNTGTSTTATTAPTLPAATTAGNLIVLSYAADDYNATPNTGWTESSEMRQHTFHGGYLWWAAATAAMTIPSYTIASAVRSTWVLTEYMGPFDASPYDGSQGNFSTAAVATITSDSLTPTAGDRLVVGDLMAQVGSAGPIGVWGSITGSFIPAVAVEYSGANPSLTITQAKQVVTATGSTAYAIGGTNSSGGGNSRSTRIIAFKKGAAGPTYDDDQDETLSATETVEISQLVRSGPIAETAASADTVAGLLDATRIVAETAAAAETLTKTLSFTGAIAETAAAAETLTGGLAFVDTVAETAGAVDTTTKTVSFTGAIVETAGAAETAGGLLVRVGAIAETASAAETVGSLLTFTGAVAESASAAETIVPDIIPAGAIYDKDQVETAAAADTVGGLLTYNVTVAEAAAAAETITRAVSYTGAVVETAAAADTVGGLMVRVGAVAESASAADTPAGLLTFTVAIAEAASAAENIIPIVVPAGGTLYEETVLETLAALDEVSADVIRASGGGGIGHGGAGGGKRRRHLFIYENVPANDDDEEDEELKPQPKRKLRLKKAEVEEKIEGAIAWIEAGSPRPLQPMSQQALVAEVSTVLDIASLIEADRRRVERTIYRYVAALLAEEEEEEGVAMMLLAA